MEEKKTVSINGIGFIGVLTVAFIVLKLCGVISWSWVWVLSPLWIGAIAGVALFLIVVIIALIVAIIKNR